jgi:hypothetical protein
MKKSEHGHPAANKLRDGKTMRKSAVISPCGRFRYELRREWDERLPPFVAGMLNPSRCGPE